VAIHISCHDYELHAIISHIINRVNSHDYEVEVMSQRRLFRTPMMENSAEFMPIFFRTRIPGKLMMVKTNRSARNALYAHD